MSVKVTKPEINVREKLKEIAPLEKPLGYIPAFCVSGSIFTGTVFRGDAIVTNNGDHFNTVDGKFTAPVSGAYMFIFSLTPNDGNSHFVDIHVDGNLTGYHQLQYASQWESATQNIIINLSKGQYVEARIRDASYSVYNAVFSGYLIG